MAFDDTPFADWLGTVERDLDPAAKMLHFIREEIRDAMAVDPFQLDAITSTTPTIAMVVARQAGKSCVLAAKGVMALERGETVICLAPAERQTREITRKVQAYLRATDLVIERGTQTEIEVNTGGRFIAVPASGATIRGYSADLLLVDECAYIPNDEETIVALLPMLKDDGQVIYASTPAGKKNFFANLFLEPKDDVHRIKVRGTDIPRLAKRVERLRSQLSATRFRQEVECEFLSDGMSYFDLSAIEQATSQEGAVCPKL